MWHQSHNQNSGCSRGGSARWGTALLEGAMRCESTFLLLCFRLVPYRTNRSFRHPWDLRATVSWWHWQLQNNDFSEPVNCQHIGAPLWNHRTPLVWLASIQLHFKQAPEISVGKHLIDILCLLWHFPIQSSISDWLIHRVRLRLSNILTNYQLKWGKLSDV